MLTKKQIQQKEKDFKKWARNDAKDYVYKYQDKEKISDYFARCSAIYYPERLINQFNYSSEQADQIINHYNTQFWRGYEYYNNRRQIENLKMQKYLTIFEEAEKFAKTVDVSEIQDGFPCGSVHLYLAPGTNKELERLLKSQNDGSTIAYKLKLPIKMPSYGQCIEYSRKLCEEVQKFLQNKNIQTLTHSWID